MWFSEDYGNNGLPGFTCSLGLLALLSSHDSTLPTVMVCSSSGAFTRMVNRVPGPKWRP